MNFVYINIYIYKENDVIPDVIYFSILDNSTLLFLSFIEIYFFKLHIISNCTS